MSSKLDQELYNQIVPQEVADRIDARHNVQCKVGHLFWGYRNNWIGMFLDKNTMLYCKYHSNLSNEAGLKHTPAIDIVEWCIQHPEQYQSII